MQTVHIDDLCTALRQGVEMGLTGTFTVAEPEGLAYRDLLGELARRMGKRPILVPLPYGPVLLALRIVEMMRLPFGIS